MSRYSRDGAAADVLDTAKHPERAIGRRTGSRNTTTRSAVEELPRLVGLLGSTLAPRVAT